jgi:predicted Zn finger-like uncharacterized protein
MAERIIHCPQCQHQLRVPEEMLGRLVKCPLCSTAFTVPTEGTPVEPTAAPPRPPREEAEAPPRRSAEGYAAGERYEERFEEGPRRRRPEREGYGDYDHEGAKAAVVGPAICLLITGILGILACLFQLVITLVDPDRFQKTYAQFGLEAPPLGVMVAIPVVFSVLGLLIMVAAIQMMRRRTYGLAMAGAILAMVNISNCCCVLGLPFGIWALVVLARPEVKAAFE